ncbi:thiamine phosphate synthase [Desulfotomaculum copahuensis]|nr:thiamine phosphate synthase [Desulfotomaculum copahuensis]
MNRSYRVLDANLNRAREGLRVIEELARFVLDDQQLATRIRFLRHGLHEPDSPGFLPALLAARDAGHDVGAVSPPETERPRAGYVELAAANFKRVQEAARVLEEYGRPVMDAGKFKAIRFQSYELEKELIGRLLELPENERYAPAGGSAGPAGDRKAGGRWPADCSLYVITGDKFARGRSPQEIAAAAIRGGAGVLQLREKKFSGRRLVEVGRELRRLTREAGVLFVVDDRVDVALAVDADGVHLGQDDLPIEAARQMMGPQRIIGISTHSVEQARRAELAGADYIGVGPVFETSSKEDVIAPVGLELVRRVAQVVRIPKVAIGGIKAHNAGQAIAAGADGVAVITAVVAAEDVAAAAVELRRQVAEARGNK